MMQRASGRKYISIALCFVLLTSMLCVTAGCGSEPEESAYHIEYLNKDKTCIILDDMVDTAGTLCNAANALVTKGGAKAVFAGATHGVLSGPAFDRIEESVISEMVLLDTIPLTNNTPSGKIKNLKIAPIFAEAISRIYSDRPVSPLVG